MKRKHSQRLADSMMEALEIGFHLWANGTTDEFSITPREFDGGFLIHYYPNI